MSATPLFAATELGGRQYFESGAWSFSESEKDRIIELMMALQSSLDVERTLARFSDYLAESLPHVGMTFSSLKGPERSIDRRYTHGAQANFGWRILLYAAGKELGWLEFHLDEMPPVDQRRQTEHLLRYLIQPLQNAIRFDRMRQEVLLDELTGLGSRAALMRALNHEVARVRRSKAQTNLSMIVMDLDGFKTLNDELGHLAGDLALRRAANAAKAALRDCDRLFRYGGDEFVALLPDADEAAAKTVASRLEDMIRTHCTEPQLEMSAGASKWQPGMAPLDFFSAADEALYARKRERKALNRPNLTNGQAVPRPGMSTCLPG